MYSYTKKRAGVCVGGGGGGGGGSTKYKSITLTFGPLYSSLIRDRSLITGKGMGEGATK